MLVRLAQPAIVCCLWVLSHEGVIDCLIACEYLAVHLALVVVPDFSARSRKDGLDGEQEPHLLWLENAALRVDEWDTFALEKKPWLQFFPRQMVVHCVQPSYLFKGCHAHLDVSAVLAHSDLGLSLKYD